jgi:hypothetical protein
MSILRAKNWARTAFGTGAAVMLAWAGAITTSSAKISASKADFAAHAQKAYAAAKAQYAADPNNAEAAWQFGRTCYDWASYSTTSRQREDIAKQGMAACQSAIERAPSVAAGHYYLAMDMGQLAQTKRMGALSLVARMEVEFKTALQLDQHLDYAGPDRNLGLLYHQAPGWPLSLGSKVKARQHLLAALKLAPDYPENLLNLMEAEEVWDDWNSVAQNLKTLDDLWPAARAKFTGADWASSWADWETRRNAVRRRLVKHNAESPRPGSS